MLILKPRTQYEDERAGSVYTEANALYNLFCYPLTGEYDDYGRIENIVHDENVNWIEKKLGITVEQLVEIATCSRNTYDSYGAICETFFENPELIDEDIETLLTGVGFSKNDEGIFTLTHEHVDYYVSLTGKEYEVRTESSVFANRNKTFKNKYVSNEYFLEEFAKETDFYLGMKNYKTFTMVKDVCSCFVLKEIVDNLFKDGKVFKDWRFGDGRYVDLSPGIAVDLGFEMSKTNANIFTCIRNKRSYTLDFTEYNVTLNGDNTNYLKEFKDKTKSDFEYELKALETKCDLDFCGFEIGIAGNEKYTKTNLCIGDSYQKVLTCSVFDRNESMRDIYVKAFRDWKLADIATLTEKLLRMFNYTHNMLMPTCGASQDDYRDITLTLNKEVQKWVKAEKKRYEEDY